jgi:DNA-binding MarR family transcriptional regulator
MAFDALVANPGRLTILTELAVEERQEFVHLRQRTRLTDGNLAAHGKRLRAAGLIEIDKQFRDGKPVTTYLLTATGRKALEAHARRLLTAISQRRMHVPAATATAERPAAPPKVDASDVAVAPDDSEDWVD